MSQKATAAKVAVMMGSSSDEDVMRNGIDLLRDFGVEVEAYVMSAHRSPQEVAEFVSSAADHGFSVIIAGAGGAAHLAGAVAANTALPVIGVPIDSSSLGGLDSLLSTVNMPPGVPVATVSIGRWGAVNAALLAVQILALGDEVLACRLRDYKEKQGKAVSKLDSD